jgi:glycosyltransferase involved in cell wall biosynthesis
MAEPRVPTFDLVLATVDRVDEPRRLLQSLERQTHRAFRLLVVDQNNDDRLAPVLEAHPGIEIVRLRAERGLSRARNAALAHLTADVIAFPDDDCTYAGDLLARVGGRLAHEPNLDGLTGRGVDAGGGSSPSWERDGAVLTTANLWNRAVSYTIFLRRAVVDLVGPFDEELGLGAVTAWRSGEEIEYLLRAVRAGARIEYDPSLTVRHDEKPLAGERLRAAGERDGGSVGYILRKHRYPAATVARMLVRPAGGAAISLVRGDVDRARFHAATLHGRIAGYVRARATRAANSSA